MNREKLEETFENYASNYDLSNPKIKLKYIHTKKVAKNSEQIAVSLGMNQEEQDLVWEIGMLHDIGRFEQLRQYNTFMDSESLDHAEYGAKLLFDEGLIQRFDCDTTRYDLIKKAIRYHSAYQLPNDLTKKELLFCQIIRDADKVDIFRANYETGMEEIYNVTTKELEEAEITQEVYQAFLEEHTVLRSLKKTPIDHLIGHLSLYYGLVYEESRKMAIEQGYMLKLANFHSKNQKTEEILEEVRGKLF